MKVLPMSHYKTAKEGSFFFRMVLRLPVQGEEIGREHTLFLLAVLICGYQQKDGV